MEIVAKSGEYPKGLYNQTARVQGQSRSMCSTVSGKRPHKRQIGERESFRLKRLAPMGMEFEIARHIKLRILGVVRSPPYHALNLLIHYMGSISSVPRDGRRVPNDMIVTRFNRVVPGFYLGPNQAVTSGNGANESGTNFCSITRWDERFNMRDVPSTAVRIYDIGHK